MPYRVCRSDDALYRSTVLPVVSKADQRSHDEKCVNWNEAAIRELLTIRAEAEIVRQFSEMMRGALYTSHEMSRVFTGSLRVVWMHAQIPENHWQCEWTKIRPSWDKSRDTFSVYFPEWLCERGYRRIYVDRDQRIHFKNESNVNRLRLQRLRCRE